MNETTPARKVKTYREVRAEVAASEAPGLVCRVCKAPAPWETLSANGARCGPCFAAYCAQPLPKGPDPKRVTKAFPRRQGRVDPQAIGALLHTKPSREALRESALELGIDVDD